MKPELPCTPHRRHVALRQERNKEAASSQFLQQALAPFVRDLQILVSEKRGEPGGVKDLLRLTGGRTIDVSVRDERSDAFRPSHSISFAAVRFGCFASHILLSVLRDRYLPTGFTRRQHSELNRRARSSALETEDLAWSC